MKKVDVPPILFRTVFLSAAAICLTPPERCGDAWLAGCYPTSPAITATRPNKSENSLRRPAHSPCSQLHARPAGRISTPAGGLLPHRFNPYPHPGRMPGPLAGILSVAVVVTRSLLAWRPHLLFHEATVPSY